MADSSLSPAKAILLAVQASTDADIPTLRTLVAQHRKALRTDIILRLLLTYLPESLDPAEYVPFLQDLASGQISTGESAHVDTSAVEDISPVDAIKKVKRLHLLPLAWPSAPEDVPEDPLVLFLIHRAYRIDEETGLITQLPALVSPFLDHSPFLRTWIISTLLPLLRLNYEYHPQDSTVQTISAFEALDDRAGVNLLLRATGRDVNDGDDKETIGRDLRGLVGPWLYGDSRSKRRKLRKNSGLEGQTVAPLDEPKVEEDLNQAGWEEVFKWITSQATLSWQTCVQAIEQWDGPGDVDLDGYGNGTAWQEEHQQQMLEQRYARAALAAAYLIPEASVEALTGVQRILARLIVLLDFNRIPTLSAAAALLAPIPTEIASAVAVAENATYLRTGLMEEQNALTTPNAESIIFLHGLLVSAYLLSRAGVRCTIRKTGELVLLQDESDQMTEFVKFIHKINNGPRGDDKYWIRIRNEILWLRNWGAEEAAMNSENPNGRGVFGKVKRDFLEKEILKALLANTSQWSHLTMLIISSSTDLS